MHEQKTYISGFGFSSTHFRTASSVALIGALMSIIGRGCRGRSGEYSSTGRFPFSFAWISGGGSDELPDNSFSGLHAQFHQLTLGHLGYPSMRPPLERMSGLQKVRSQQELIFLAALLQWSLWCCLGFCSRGSGWGGTSAWGIDGPASSGGAFPICNGLSMYPNPKPPDFISACSLIDSSLNVQDRKAGRAKCLLNQGSPASVSNILVIIAAGVIHAVVFSKIALHSRRISGTALAARFVISICPIGSPRVAATSAAVIWIDCPFWSCKVQLLGSKFSTNHNPNLRGTLYEAHHRRVLLSHPPQYHLHSHPHSLPPYYHLVLGFELALPVVGQHAPGQAAECVLLLDRVQSLFWVPLLWMSPPVQLLFFCCLHDIFNLN
nr:hypothetical protein Iba_chr09cCG6530 [Ipomoea batatas]